MKGGYQILDLTIATAGDPVTIPGVYNTIKSNNGKPVMIITTDGQRVFSQVTEDDGDYLLTYLSGEGKTVKVVIDDEDSVTTTIEDDSASIEALSEGLNDLRGKSVKKATYQLNPSGTLYLQPGTDNPLPYMYLITMYGSSGESNRAYIGCGYGATTARHQLAKLLGDENSNITLTVANDNYGLTIYNGGTAKMYITVTSFLAG